MATFFYYVRPDEIWSLDAVVTGTVATGYTRGWLVDGRNGRPVRGAAGTGALSLALAKAAGEVGLVAVCNHNIKTAATINITGGITAALTVDNVRQGEWEIPRNPYAMVGPASVSALTLAVAGNGTRDVMIGEFIAGKVRTLEREPLAGSEWTPWRGGIASGDRTGAVPNLGLDIAGETITFHTLVSTEDALEAVKAWHACQLGESVPSLIVPYDGINDAWLVHFTDLKVTRHGAGVSELELTFVEYARTRWR